MARDEMDEITEDRWEDDIWGSVLRDTGTSSSSSSAKGAVEATVMEHHDPPKLFFLFGRTDHWVADHTRDELMAARGTVKAGRSSSMRNEEDRQGLLEDQEHSRAGAEWRPFMEIDESGVPHGFCIREFVLVYPCDQARRSLHIV